MRSTLLLVVNTIYHNYNICIYDIIINSECDIYPFLSTTGIWSIALDPNILRVSLQDTSDWTVIGGDISRTLIGCFYHLTERIKCTEQCIASQ